MDGFDASTKRQSMFNDITVGYIDALGFVAASNVTTNKNKDQYIYLSSFMETASPFSAKIRLLKNV